MQRVRLFVDYWNFHLSLRALSRVPLTVDWSMFGLRAAQSLSSVIHNPGGGFRCEGIHIYGSFNASESWQAKLAKDMLEKHALVPGVFPVFERRETQASTRKCDSCGAAVVLSPELGIDVRLAIDVVKFSNFDHDEVLMLAANDGDFIPLVEYLTALGRKVVHLHPERANHELSKRCWANLALEKLERDAFPYDSGPVLLRVQNDDGYVALAEHLKAFSIEYQSLDLATVKPTKYELYRVFADNQNYPENFISADGGLQQFDAGNPLNDIHSYVNLAHKRPDLLNGPFLLYEGQIMNRALIKRRFGIEL